MKTNAERDSAAIKVLRNKLFFLVGSKVKELFQKTKCLDIKRAMYYFKRTVPMPLEEADREIRKTLQEQGFGILTEINVHEVLKKKLGETMEPYRILGACNPHFAHQVMQKDRHIGALLPCNVVLRSLDEQTTEIIVMDPEAALGIVKNNEIEEIAREVRNRLETALQKLA